MSYSFQSKDLSPLVKFIPNYFGGNVIVKWMMFFIYFSDNLLLVYRNVSDFLHIILYPSAIHLLITFNWASQVVLVIENPSASAGDIRHVGLIPGLGRSPGEGHCKSLQYSCLENPMDRGI